MLEHLHPEFSSEKGVGFVKRELQDFTDMFNGEGTKQDFLDFIKDRFRTEIVVGEVPPDLIVGVIESPPKYYKPLG